MTWTRLTKSVCFTAIALGLAPMAGFAQEPVRLETLLGAPDNLSISAVYRVRYETLDGRFRSGLTGSDQILAERLLIAAEYDFGNFYIGGELQDSRQQLADTGTPIGTDDSNAVELLRAYVGWRGDDTFLAGDSLDLTFGRITIDAGSRRLSARNGFRNTINGFTGLHARWTGPQGDAVQAFYTLPVARRPTSQSALLSNDIDVDEENFNVGFWGLHYTRPNLFRDLTGEIYIFGLHEDDREELQTRDRELYTPGFRLYQDKAVGAFDYEFETALQFGEAAFSSSPTAPALDQFAHFHHLHLGYTFNNPWKTRLVVQYDYASGDSDPADDQNGRFETLFGARRFEFGPTGIFGPLARSNINSPGVRVEAKPGGRWQGFVGYRAAFLASSRDALLTAGLSDPTGASGNTIGHQFETRLRYKLLPGNVHLETGAAYLIDGRFLSDAPSASPDSDTFYAYTQITLSF